MRRVVAILCAALLLSACSGEDNPEPLATGSSTPGPVLATAKPKVTVPQGPAPKDLVTTDLVVGTGQVAVPGQVLTVHYVGVDFADGKQFDASWDRGNGFPFRLGNEDVIQGWDKGMIGMRVGGRRMLVIPPEMAYGNDPTVHELAGKTLVFVVDLMSVGGGPAVVDPTP